MKIDIRYGTAGVDWNKVVQIFEKAPLGTREPNKLRRACENSYLVICAYEQAKLIGFGRAISDGEYQAAVYDIVVLPEYQRSGVGRLIMKSIIDKLPVSSIILFAVPGKEGFYEKLDFKRLKTGMGKFENYDIMKAYEYIE